MNDQSDINIGIRRVGIAVCFLLLLLVGQLTYLQVVEAKTLAHHEDNTRDQIDDLRRPRGTILSADGKVLARSIATNDSIGRQREYPLGELTAQIVGYDSIVVGATGVEKTYNDELVGRGPAQGSARDRVGDFIRGRQRTGNVELTLRVDAQLLAKQRLGNQRGSVVVLEPATGRIVTMYSNPSFDPQPLAGHTQEKVQRYFEFLNSAPGNPALPRAYREIFPPGSTFKVVTATSALDEGVVTLDTTFPTLRSILPPQAGRPISNFGGSSCGGDLTRVFMRSCNTAFAQMGLLLGDSFPPQMRQFGVGLAPPLDIAPGAARSTGPVRGTFEDNKPLFALAGIGQGEVATTPLQMALVAGAIANGGVVMEPHVGRLVRDDEGRIIATIKDRPWRRATNALTAATVRDMMIDVVNDRGGTGTAARIDGITVAGKTGTAQTVEGAAPHAWFVAFAPAEAPRYAVAVMIENGGDLGNEATGGQVAAPIARDLLQYLLLEQPNP